MELEEENNALEQEHLVMLKKQDQMGSGVNTENSEMSTMAETKLNMDESQQKVAVKEKQIELLSNMLHQKDTIIKDN